MNNPKQDVKLQEMRAQIRSEVIGALAQRAELDEVITRGRAMLAALDQVHNAPKESQSLAP